MRYFEINTLGNDQDRVLAFLDRGVEDCPDSGRLAAGEAVGADYPADARIYLQPESPGLKLSSLLGNTVGYLVIDTPMKTILEKLDLRRTELLPFSLYDHRKRLRSKEYWIVNPVGTVDVVDRRASDIELLPDDPSQIVVVNRFVFDAKKLAHAPDLFRVPEEPQHYFVSERVPASWHGQGFTNLYLEEIDVA